MTILFASLGPSDALLATVEKASDGASEAVVVRPIEERHRRHGFLGYLPGPDNSSVRRLAIDDTTGVSMIFDGRLRQRKSLRRRLAGVDQEAWDDAELALRAYHRLGDACVEHFDGSWCLALLDPRRGGLLLAQDRFATRRLYFRTVSDTVFASSSARVLACLPQTASICGESFLELLYRQTIEAPRTIFKSVVALEPGCLVWIFPDHRQERRYWSFSFAEEALSTSEAVNLVEEALAAVSDTEDRPPTVPLVTLSGGIDSSLIATYMARHGTRFQPTTVSVSWSEEEVWDETAKARTVAEHLGRELRVIETVPAVFPERLRAHVRAMDQPIPLGLGISLLAQAVAGEIEDGYTGLGSDELFFGYPEINRILFPQTRTDLIDAYLKLGALFGARTVAAVGASIGVPFAPVKQRIREAMDETVYRTGATTSPEIVLALMLHHFLVPGDVYSNQLFSAAFGLDLYHPFLEQRIVELVERLPTIHSGAHTERVGKPLLREVARRAGLPSAIWRAAKHGFGVPALELTRLCGDSCRWFLEPAAGPPFADVLADEALFDPAPRTPSPALASYRLWARRLFAAWMKEISDSGGVS